MILPLGVVLLPAKEWCYDLPENVSDLGQLAPYITEYFDHIVSKCMDLEEEDRPLRDYLGIHIGYHTGYIDEVWSRKFAGQIRREHHRQLLFDPQTTSVGKEANRVDLLTEECWALHRGIRDQILQGAYDPPGINAFKFTRPVREEVGTRVTMTLSPADMKFVDYSN